MTKKIAKHQIDPAKLPPLTRQQKAELAALAAMPDKQIDTSDITPFDLPPKPVPINLLEVQGLQSYLMVS